MGVDGCRIEMGDGGVLCPVEEVSRRRKDEERKDKKKGACLDVAGSPGDR